ncbi:hypothetical protein ACIRPH_05255 [Nocardiopsis sp. NPDC101807]|uniref:hypothetical protein n=1 Tax=Nocardiopsis sp. NPDC101807 TaxID=3364339 RepID=UPI00381EBAD2
MDLTLTEAWTLWWSGQQLTEHSIHGMSVLWAARVGKFMAFLAGTTIVLDLIGGERLIEWGRQIRGPKHAALSGRTAYLFAGLVGAPLVYVAHTAEQPNDPFFIVGFRLLSILLIIGAFIATVWAGPRLVTLVGNAFSNQKLERLIRGIAVPLFFLGFALDYLAS